MKRIHLCRMQGAMGFAVSLGLFVMTIGLAGCRPSLIGNEGTGSDVRVTSSDEVDEPVPPTADGAENPDATALAVDATEQTPQDIRRRALQYQLDESWCEAEAAWRQLLERIGDDREHAQLRNEAEQNFEIAAARCRPPDTGKTEVTIAEPPVAERSQRIQDDILDAHYRLGRTVRQVALTNITGQGRNKQWVFEHDAYFAYTYRILAETKVVRERPTARTFRVTFHEVRQVRAVYEDALQLRQIESPIVKIFFEEVDRHLLRHPVYAWIRTIADIGRVIDPRAKGTLTWFNNLLRAGGVRPDSSDLAVKIENLEGTVVEIEYISGIGVSTVEIIEGEAREPHELEQLAYTTSLLMDYYIFPNLDAAVGSRWEVRAEDVAAMIPFGYGYRTSGQIGIQRGPDGTMAGEPVRTLQVEAGSTVQIESHDDRRSREDATARVRSGVVEYCPSERLVRRARIAWDGTATALSTDHLLFGTERVRNLNVDTYYEAYRPEDEQRLE